MTLPGAVTSTIGSSRAAARCESPEDLARYDDNIRAHLAAINARRSQPITLLYFQYLAFLYTEIVLAPRFHLSPPPS